ncbi:T9SS C-terminal target domain-containing protein [Adhaeribacter aquaticus]|uniref:T9SS C-terminal target domain-containing protein n=1 Tax=Adhaeribacter aquaticus TaxID=299567 RepID=UPI0004215938|nr:T9SS C-terminal target domain-containing protein [Adhaeribacter aquaticus]
MKYRFTILLSLLINLACTPFASMAQWTKPTIAPQQQPPTQKSLQFIQNKNQWDKSVKYMAPLPGGNLFLQDKGFVYKFYDNSAIAHQHGSGQKVGSGPVSDKVKAHAYSVTFLNATAGATTGKSTTKEVRNYFIGNDPARWASNVRSYEEVNYEALYPGISMHLYENKAHLKYEFLVQPQVSPAVIQMQYKGAKALSLENQDLHIKTSVNEVIEKKPYAYQYVNGKEVEVPCYFKLEKNIVSFSFPEGYDTNQLLIIDPTLIFSTFSGSQADNWGFTATYDNDGNMYSGGIVQGVGFPTTTGAYNMSWNGNADGFTESSWDIGILKYKPDATGATSLLYATYIGGNRTEIPSSLVVNSKNELLILGSTSSGNFPTTPGAYDQTFNRGASFTEPIGGILYSEGSDLIITRLSPDGSRLLASTFLGGTANDGLLDGSFRLDHNYGDQFRADIFTDATDNVYIVSNTASRDFPVRNGFQNTFGGGELDAVIAKLTPELNLQWSSFLGGNGADAAYSLQLDTAGNIFICGGTTSSNLAGTTGAYKQSYTVSNTDGFVAKIKNDGTGIDRLSYLGTTAYDQAYFVQLDSNNDVFILGQTRGEYPNSPRVYKVDSGRQFIHKLNNSLTTSLLSTVFGSSNNDIRPNISPTAFLVDNCNRIYVAGWGGGANATGQYQNGNTQGLPTTNDAYQRTTDGKDFYLMMLSRDASALEYATFFGGVQAANQSGEHVDGGTSRFDKRGFVYQAVCGGCSGTSAFPTTPGAWSSTNGTVGQPDANCNNAAFKFSINITLAAAGPDQTVCDKAAPFKLTGFTPETGGTWSGPGVTADGTFTPSPTLGNTVTLTYSVANGSCISTSTKTISLIPSPTITFTGLPTAACLPSAPVTLVGSPVGGTFTGKGIAGSTFDPVIAGPGTHTITYSYITEANCTVSYSQDIIINPTITAAAVPTECGTPTNIQGFAPFTANFTNTTKGATGYLWDFGDGTTSSEQVPAHQYLKEGTYEVTLTVFFGNICKASQLVAVVVVEKSQSIPNIFTPNRDGVNDTFAPRITCLPTDLRIFNRWGNLVYEQKNYQNNWGGENLTDGIYFYQLTSTKGETWKGWIEIVR